MKQSTLILSKGFYKFVQFIAKQLNCKASWETLNENEKVKKNQYKIIKAYFFIFLPLLFSACQPMELQYANTVQIPSNSDQNEISEEDSQIAQNFLTRSSQNEFKEHFLSNKLDLVFILDTSPGMESFYKNNPFGANFLNQFQTYDWKLAYTDMSLDIQTITDQESSDSSKKDSCNFFSGLAMTAGGFLIGQGSPFMTSLGIKELSKCKMFDKKSNSKESNYANGAFLPFEYKGQILETKNLNQITKETANYNMAFDHSLSLSNKSKKTSFSAPILKQTESYPILSTFFSIARALNLVNSSDNNNKSGFFREDSLIVYVLVTTQDMQTKVSSEKFAQSIESAFETKQRFKLVLITLTDDSPLFCSLKLQKTSTESEKLRHMAKKLNYPSLDICSKILGETLFSEISKNLDSKNLLN